MWVGFALFAFVGFWLGGKYSDFRDLMLARRVSKVIEAGQRMEAEKKAWDSVVEREVRSGSLRRRKVVVKRD